MLPGADEEVPQAGRVSVAQLQQLFDTGLSVGLRLDRLEQLQTILQDHSAWEFRINQVLAGTFPAEPLVSLVTPRQQRASNASSYPLFDNHTRHQLSLKGYRDKKRAKIREVRL